VLVVFTASGAFVGYTPVFPGTAGSVVGLFLAKLTLGGVWRSSSIELLGLFGILFMVACGVAACAERIFAEPDCSVIVLDEIFGMIATMFGNPTSWPCLIAGFTLFRLFDIIKPWPASWFDRMHGGVAVMLDDLVAAGYANVALHLLLRIFKA
jgi:phosphatidylglycerophosphatase A